MNIQRMNLVRFAFAFALPLLSLASANADSTIVIIRHGEKPAQGLGQLTCQGLNRALALPSVLLPRYGKPQAIYAPNPAVLKTDNGIPYAYVRPLATIEPLAIQAGLPISVEGGMAEIEPLASRILTASTGTHVITWEHHWAESLTKHLLTKLGGDPTLVPRWEEKDYDSIYVIRTKDNGSGDRHVSFSHERQGLNNLPETCGEATPVPRP